MREAWQGTIVSILIAEGASVPMVSVNQVRAVAEEGLEGDRYFTQTGYWSNRTDARPCAVTLIESETLEALKRESGIELAPGDTRRNILTRGVPLNHLVDREFQVGEVILRGFKLCEPCAHLEQLFGKPIMSALLHRGGLRAHILTDGFIRVADTVREL